MVEELSCAGSYGDSLTNDLASEYTLFELI